MTNSFKRLARPLRIVGLVAALGVTTVPGYGSDHDFDRVYGSVEALAKAHERYSRLASENAWSVLESHGVLGPGSIGPQVVALRQRLAAEGYRVGAKSDSKSSYDKALAQGVRDFQDRHGLAVDGKVGPMTLDALNVSPAQREHQIAVNVTRRQEQSARAEGTLGILVNLPEQRLYAFDPKGKGLDMKVIVGEVAWSTPELHEQLETVEINPYWYVPIEIVAADIVAEIKTDPNYLAANHMEVVDKPGPSAIPVDPAKVDWKAIRGDEPKSFPYFLRQKPGKTNPLGRIKFMMPNSEDIYLHDTPAGQLFNESERDLSHGCIRVERPLDLADFISARTDGWKRSDFQRAIDSGEMETVQVTPHIPVDIVYWTAWADRDGNVHFRDDIYDRDQVGGGKPAPTEAGTR